ncbi:hypothetical protein BMS3Abin17_01013 [archaeon BMS3Abin17]|nr:hypothetical protein BMS3Abin17_01013 [archaeon BMS3Abin17]HDZ61241.1 hypothetical protein [Candidatus Pacearchaeota archaeon]
MNLKTKLVTGVLTAGLLFSLLLSGCKNHKCDSFYNDLHLIVEGKEICVSLPSDFNDDSWFSYKVRDTKINYFGGRVAVYNNGFPVEEPKILKDAKDLTLKVKESINKEKKKETNDIFLKYEKDLKIATENAKKDLL